MGEEMSDRFTVTSREGFGSRIGNALKGVVFGPLFIIAAIALLWWNEGRAVQAITGLREAAGQVVEVDDSGPVPANNNKLVHVVGTATAQSPIQDTDTGITFERHVGVARTAEMFQWKENKRKERKENADGSETTTTTYEYTREWSPDFLDSSKFAHPEGHQNPGIALRNARFSAADAKLGGWTLDANTLNGIEYAQDVTPSAANGWTRSGAHLYRGDPASPKIGDTRVQYSGLPSDSTISVLALQSAGGFATFTAQNGYQMHLAVVGNSSADELIADQRRTESLETWAWRGAGVFLMLAGVGLILQPLSTLASIVPLLGWIVQTGTAVLSLALALALSLFVIALAWLAYRPLLAGGLILLAGAVMYAFWRWRRKRSPPAAPLPAMPPGA